MGYVSVRNRDLTGGMIVPIGLVGRQTGTPAADTTIFALRNTGLVAMYLRRLLLKATFDGTAAATTALYRLCRFTTATPTNGTAIVPVVRNAAFTLPTYDAREAVAGVTTTNCVFDAGIFVLSCQRQVVAVSELDIHEHNSADMLCIPAGSGIAIRLSAAAVVGDCLTGHAEIDWA
jgi:hypothetical protein